MTTVFVLNPMAGKKKTLSSLENSINKAAKDLGANVEIYYTQGVGDAKVFVENYCRKNGKARFIACGGDGTVGEVLSGAMISEDAQIGVMPFGTGNDFCRNFGEKELFLNPLTQITGESVRCDCIKYDVLFGKEHYGGYCANMFNIGFDCNVVDMTDIIKKKPLISGSFAYYISILVTLIKKKGADLKIILDDKKVYDGRLLLTSLANGKYCGGGIKSNPLADVQDGFIDVNIIRNTSRINFLSKLPFYMKGTHLGIKGIESLISNIKCKKAKIISNKTPMRICIDGEIISAVECSFELIPSAFNFVIPGNT